MSHYADKVVVYETRPEDVRALYELATKANQLTEGDIKTLDFLGQMAVCVMIEWRHRLLVKSHRKALSKPFTWTMPRTLLLAAHHLCTHSEMLDTWSATLLLQTIDKYK